MCCVLNFECVHIYGIVCVCACVHVEYVYMGRLHIPFFAYTCVKFWLDIHEPEMDYEEL